MYILWNFVHLNLVQHWNLPTYPCPTLSAGTKLIFKGHCWKWHHNLQVVQCIYASIAVRMLIQYHVNPVSLLVIYSQWKWLANQCRVGAVSTHTQRCGIYYMDMCNCKMGRPTSICVYTSRTQLPTLWVVSGVHRNRYDGLCTFLWSLAYYGNGIIKGVVNRILSFTRILLKLVYFGNGNTKCMIN